ncbi:SMI1 / KNR4 family protein [Hirsutella rhossiliensis]|uniref:SMI1 / KNR4 family (SUKH-1) domain-containing protein n=1 Tax=Hirsutella rhossiliensis TaxID=111463 RepID=A0A9P8N3I7_9HYPO|nr:SMI1 / KNR4 family (SUKH-1) domain-containing protein [Hirsutella rhossiliensis]KAH0965189.1 SMI1 / KNR4 family (SUKH-1) domain-containing protein [Hirsutella rhossiliensis]
MDNSSFGSALRSFWHTMTSYDRHSSYHSPHRTGRHVPLQTGRNSILTGVATASDSHPDVGSPYSDEAGRVSPPAANGTNGSYSPGLRSMAAKQADGFEVQSPGDVPMQSFHDGLPPPPPVRHSWKKIDAWAEENYPELVDQLCEGATTNDLNDLEHQLDCSLPQDVRDSLMIHDGQERGGNPTGIIFGSMLLDCEEIVQEWETWRKVNQQFLPDMANAQPTTPSKAFGGSSEASSSRQRPSSSSTGSNADEWRQNLLSRQDSVPTGAVQKTYAHVGWIPLVRDWGGNNLAVDLAPGPGGRWGQVVMFGRDYDTKYVVARSWAAFLALVADDLNSGKWFVDEDNGELKLREFKETRVEPAYFSILRWRMDQKYGRRAARRASLGPPKSGSPLGSRSGSPYASPSEPNGDVRGRSAQRFGGSSPLASPITPAYGKPPPLSRVTEETTIPEIPSADIEPSQLVEVEMDAENEQGKNALRISTIPRSQTNLLSDKENEPPSSKVNGKQPATVDGMMKTIEI